MRLIAYVDESRRKAPCNCVVVAAVLLASSAGYMFARVSGRGDEEEGGHGGP